MIFFFSY